MCAAALRRVGLTKVYFGCYNERFGGCGSIIPVHTDYIKEGIDPTLEITLLKEYRKDCIELLRQFYMLENERAPIPKKKAKRIFKPVDD
jgi:tRNA-specific adenosine deaminase 2